MTDSGINDTVVLICDANETPDEVEQLRKEDSEICKVAQEVVERLMKRNETLAVAESLTGGLVMTYITSAHHSSDVFRGGVVTYATPLKHKLLGVDSELITEHGVINGEVALQMAFGVQHRTSVADVATTWGLSTTGVAGETWQDGKPPGTMFIGLSSKGESKYFGPLHLREGESKASVRRGAAKRALEILLDALKTAGSEDHGIVVIGEQSISLVVVEKKA